MFVISRRIILDSYWQSFYRFSWIFGIAALVSLVLWIGVAKAAELGSVNGVLQRLFIGVWFIWVEVMAIRLFSLSSRSKISKIQGWTISPQPQPLYYPLQHPPTVSVAQPFN